MSRISFELENISEIRSAILLLFAFYKTEGHTFQKAMRSCSYNEGLWENAVILGSK